MPPSAFLSRVRLRGEPLPDPGAVIVHGECRVTILAPRLLRLEWAPQGRHDDRPTFAFPHRYAPSPPFHFSVNRQTLTVDTGALRLVRQGTTGPFSADNLSIGLEVGGLSLTWRPGDQDDRNLRGARRTLDGCRGEAALEPGLLSRSGWALIDDSASVRFDPDTGWVLPRPEGPTQDWYFFGYGHSYTDALAEYARFGGAAPMIPRWALGAWWSRYWAYSEQDLRRLVAEFARHDLPLAVLVIDMDWHTPHGWTGYTWNRALFPDPPAFLAWLHQQGLRVTLNLHPAEGVHPHEEAHAAFAAALGHNPSAPIPFRMSDQAFAQSYFELLHHPLEAQGVDFWWIDWQQGRTSELPGLDPLPWLNHLHFQDLRRRPGRRPIIFSRWGGLGNHRYPIGFSGDTYATWESLRFQPYFTATAANVLYGWWSHDIGGHFGACEPELFVRWVQLGALSPILRIHSTNDPAAERRPWAFAPHIRAAARAAFSARYELLPYLYTLARLHHDCALAPCRPLYYTWPQSESAYLAREQYQLGDQVIVAPVVRPTSPPAGLAPVDVWVPPGEWIERTTGELLRGPAWARLVAALEAIPQLVRAGGILPLAPAAAGGIQPPGSPIILSIFPGPEGALRIYEDQDEGEGYQEDQFEWTPVTMRTTGQGAVCTITIGPVEGRCAALPPERTMHVHLEFARAPLAVRLNGVDHADWSYETSSRRVVIALPARPKQESATLVIEASEPLSLLGAATNLALRVSDARRLLGPAAEPPWTEARQQQLLQHPGLWDEAPERSALLDVALAGGTEAHQSAIARLGGPFAHVYEYTTPEDASHTLGALVVAAPRDGTPVGLAGIWRLAGPEGQTEIPFDLGQIEEDTIVSAPFAWERDVAARRWSLDLTLRWRGREIFQTFTSQTLFPTIGAWRTLAAPAAQAYAIDQVLGPDGAVQASLPWAIAVHSPAHGEFQNLTELFNVPLSRYANASIDLVGYAATTLNSPGARPVTVAYQSPRPARIFLNGAEVATATFAESSALGLNPLWSRTAPVWLAPGPNTLLLVTEWKGEGQPWRWFLHVAVHGADGLPATGLVVGEADPMLE